MALVLGMAGMMFFTTPCVNDRVTPGMPNAFARSRAFSKTQRTWSGSSPSNAGASESDGVSVFSASASRFTRNSLGHWISRAYSMQCAAHRGVSAKVHSGNATCGGKSHDVHSKHGVTPGNNTRAWPLNPSVPPSIIGLIDAGSTLPSLSKAMNEHATLLTYALASMESNPRTITWNCLYHSSGFSSMRQWCGVTTTPATRRSTARAAHSALL
mmetsp:Transcript_14221/g.59902  ORF Transcript_14221/g.59902 Transcript_14221/m.59902 type:complete len:213 (+) Transcript_14221:420-1058(+)